MGSLDDDDESGVGSSDNDVDDTMEDLDEGEGNGDLDVDGAEMEDNDENEDDDEADESQSRPRTEPPSRQNSTSIPIQQGSEGSPASPRHDSTNLSGAAYQPTVRAEAISASSYDIVPTIAAPHSTSINAVTATPDMRWVFSGGADGWVRKFHWPDTVNGKTLLTVAQRHLFVDSVTKAGVLLSYWENEETPHKEDHVPSADEAVSLSPVYSLAVQRQGLWVLSGTESGVINVQSVRHEEGKRITSLNKHMSAVSCLRLSEDEQSLLSGSWDKTVIDWDMATGKVTRTFGGSVSQISALEMRPHSNTPVPKEEPATIMSNTFSSNVGEKAVGFTPANGTEEDTSKLAQEPAKNSPTDSLFGDGAEEDSLFGDNDVNADPMDFSRELDDEFGSLTNGIGDNMRVNGDAPLPQGNPSSPPTTDMQTRNEQLKQTTDQTQSPKDMQETPIFGSEQPAVAELTEQHPERPNLVVDDTTTQGSENVFLDAAIDGILRIWDRRQQNPVSRMLPSRHTPPWCMHACWSPDGNHIYAGRRNGTVDEYSMHKGLREPSRTLRFPAGSGAVSAVRAMPNSRHLVCASFDILRLYDLHDEEAAKHSRVPFLIVPGHRTGVVSHLFIDPTCSYMISTAGNRGWEGTSAEVLLGYEIGVGR